ncbi:MAG: hypothetical protein ACLPTZ_07330 [Beijerinckiaceae bacterium]
MFVRFRHKKTRLQVSLVETRRVDGKVQYEHVASFGSVEWPSSIEARITFWQRLHERLAKLSNRVDATAHAKVLGAIHARIPMVTIDEQRTLKLENAEADERFWSRMHNINAETVEDHKGFAATIENAIASGQQEMAKAAGKRDTAKARREQLERGEDVPGGLGKLATYEDVVRELLKSGVLTKRDLRRMELVATVKQIGPEVWEVFRRSRTSVSDFLDRDTERKARAAIEYFSLCDDPVEAAEEMLARMPRR